MEKFVGGERPRAYKEIDVSAEKDPHKSMRVDIAILPDSPTPERAFSADSNEEFLEAHYARLDLSERTRNEVLAGKQPRLSAYFLERELLELGYTPSETGPSPANTKLELIRFKAKAHLEACVNEIHDLREQGGSEEQVLRRISDQVFDGTIYQSKQNSAALALAENNGERRANCEARAKLAALLLQEAGYDTEKEIFYQSFTEHVRTVVQTPNGLQVIEGGVFPYKELEGAPIYSAQDTLKTELGLEASKEFTLGTKAYHASVGDILDKHLNPLLDMGRPVSGLGLRDATRRFSEMPLVFSSLGGIMDRVTKTLKNLLPSQKVPENVRKLVSASLRKAAPGL